MFWMCEQTVRTAASSFFLPNHFSTFRTRLLDIWMSNDKCLKLRFRRPRGPLIVTTRDFTLASMPRGIFTHWFALMVFIFSLQKAKKRSYIISCDGEHNLISIHSLRADGQYRAHYRNATKALFTRQVLKFLFKVSSSATDFREIPIALLSQLSSIEETKTI